MKLYSVLFLVLGLLVSVVVAESCVSSSDCPDGSYCSYGYCVPYSSSGYGDYYDSSSDTTCCCGAALILLGLVGAIFYNAKR
ncbi:MAG: hypothetical protein QW153_02090 [Candidatus Bilamarchaeaceae archaeon]